jgi:N utilization substance protein B
VFAFYQTGNSSLKMAENELMLSIRRSYDLYHYFLLLIVEVTQMYERMIDARKSKFRPSKEDMNPDVRLLNNRLAIQISENESLIKYSKEHGISWIDDADFIKKILDLILKSDIYAEYIANKDDSYETDREFWRHVFKHLITNNAFVEDHLEEKSIYWNEDIDIIESFIIKTIKRFDEQLGNKNKLLPMFNSEGDYEFVIKLLRQTLLHGDEYRTLIDKHINNWETERLAYMDIVIMQVAIAELLNFPTIPINVTLNEYIDAAKYYSTPKSGTFVNGVLDSIVMELKKEKLLFKD